MRRTAFIAVAALLIAVTAPAQRMHSAGRLAGSTPAASPAAVDLTPCLFVLNLSDAQRLQIKQITDAEQPVVTAITNRLKSDHDALDALANVTNPDSCAIGTAYLKINADQTALRVEFTIIRTKVESVLTPDQKARLDGCLSVLANLGNYKP